MGEKSPYYLKEDNMLNKDIGNSPSLREEFALRDKALAGDMVWVVSPATVDRAATVAAWQRDVWVELQTAAGELHTWFDKEIASGISIADDSALGTAAITGTTLIVVGGRAKVVVSGDAVAWVAVETNTLTVTQAVILGYTIAVKTSVETIV